MILSNADCEAVAHNIKGVMAIPHPYGRLQFGADLDLHFRTLIGTGSNPNVAAVVVIGIEDQWAKKVADGIAATGKPVSSFGIEQHGDHDTIMRASKKGQGIRAVGFRIAPRGAAAQGPVGVDQMRRVRHDLRLRLEPDRGQRVRQALSARRDAGVRRDHRDHRRRAPGGGALPHPEVRERFMFMFDRYQEVIEKHKTSDLSDSQPTKGNIAGGLTTIEEKALGNIQKIGKKCMVDGVLDKAEVPTGPGLWFMDSSSAAAEMVTLLAAAGFVVHFFPTGQGNVIGNPILPVIKLCANPRTVRTMSEHVDVDVSGLLRREMSPDDAGDKLLECMFRTCNGRLTAAEALGHREFVLTRLYESA